MKSKSPYRAKAAKMLANKKTGRNLAARRAAAAKMLSKMTKMATVKAEPDMQVQEGGSEGGGGLQ